MFPAAAVQRRSTVRRRYYNKSGLLQGGGNFLQGRPAIVADNYRSVWRAVCIHASMIPPIAFRRYPPSIGQRIAPRGTGTFPYCQPHQANWPNPLDVTNNLGGVDFTGTPLPTVNIVADTNTVPESDGLAHYFTLTRTGDTNSDFTVPLYISGTATLGSDYTLSPTIVSNLDRKSVV